MRNVQTFVLGELKSNAYLVGCRYLIDAGGVNKELLQALTDCGEAFEAILLTHAHVDHIAGILELKQNFADCAVYSHRKAKEALQDPQLNLSDWFGQNIVIESTVSFDDYTPCVGENELHVIELPGHTRGGVCFYWPAEKMLFSGDSLFKGSIGRADLPGGDMELLVDSIRQKLLVLPDDTVVYPGHGPSTTIGAEKETNPYF